MQSSSNPPPESPDDLSPEWTEYENRWAVRVADFEDLDAATRFLRRRKEIFREAQALGIDREMLTPFAPDTPGFEARVKAAFERLASVAGFAAE